MERTAIAGIWDKNRGDEPPWIDLPLERRLVLEDFADGVEADDDVLDALRDEIGEHEFNFNRVCTEADELAKQLRAARERIAELEKVTAAE